MDNIELLKELLLRNGKIVKVETVKPELLKEILKNDTYPDDKIGNYPEEKSMKKEKP